MSCSSSKRKSSPTENPQTSKIAKIRSRVQDEFDDYHQCWTPIYVRHPNFCDAYLESAGKRQIDDIISDPARALAEQMLLVTNDEMLWDVFVSLYDSSGHLFIRDEYGQFYGKLEEEFAQPLGKVCRAVITGQRRVENSLFGLYTLLRCMTIGQPVLFSSSQETTFLIDNSGIWTCLKHELTITHLPPPSPRFWSIIDAHASQGPENSYANSGHFFSILTTPRVEKVYENWIEKGRYAFMVMNS
ncbi:hypothetical protein EST38_g10184 [Candolleomyces aberdarensis]|uniref:Uncharacterized protein n=1 Tax=Candolleomyces aberdarensis TaxID=2316362 RepID=A0A4Q2DA85_9AGAR|nr:hypothetical protein EST38_g10184 [Candolleomyces aberdarensis]